MAGVFPFAWLLPFGFGVPALVVEGTGNCPAPSAVSAELSAIMSLPEVEAQSDRAVVSNSGDEVSVGLFAATGAVLGERRVDAPGSCEEKARAVAVILATWLSDAHPELKAQLPTAVAPAPPPPEPAPVPETPAPPERQAPPRPSPATASAARSPRPARSLSFAASAGVELSSAGAVPALELTTRFAPAGTGVGVLAFVLTALPAERELGSGSVRWFRWPLGIGPLLRLAPRGVFVDLALAPTVAWLHLEGHDFMDNDGAGDAVLGGFAGVSVAGTSGPVRPCAGAGLLVWPGASTAVASAPDAELDLPAVEGTLTLGVVFVP